MNNHKITSRQKKSIMALLGDSIDKMDLSEEQANKLLSEMDGLKIDFEIAVRKYSVIKCIGSVVKTTLVTFPGNFPEPQISPAQGDTLVEICTDNSSFEGIDLANILSDLEPGKKYFIRFIEIHDDKYITSRECLKYLKDTNAILVNKKSLLALHNIIYPIFGIEYFTFHFDGDNLWKVETIGDLTKKCLLVVYKQVD